MNKRMGNSAGGYIIASLLILMVLFIIAGESIFTDVFAQEVSTNEFVVQVPIMISSGPTGISGLSIMASVDGAVQLDCQAPDHGLPACSQKNAVSMAVVDIDNVWTNEGDSASAGSIVLSGPPGSHTVQLTFPQVDDDAGNPLTINPITFSISFGP